MRAAGEISPHNLRYRLAVLFAIGSLYAGTSKADSAVYLIAATPTNYSPVSYPSALYKVTSGTLRGIRSLAAADAGVYIVERSDVALAVVSPHVIPAHIEVVHINDPEMTDAIDLNFGNRVALNGLNALFGSTQGQFELFTLVPPGSGPGKDDSIQKALLQGAAGRGERVSPASPQDYQHATSEGLPGGPFFGFSPFVTREGNSLVLAVGVAKVTIDTCPAGASLEYGKRNIAWIASSSEYRIFAQGRSREQLASNPNADTADYVHNLRTGGWTALTVPGNVSRQRLFGSWLATIVQRWSPGNAANPGRELERSLGSKQLPNVQSEYAAFQAHDAKISGILTLDNLDDGRRITLNTQVEDSEILLVSRDDRALYRVNDAIYEASIHGSSLGRPSLIVRDTNVPEIHWAFLSAGSGGAAQ